MEALLETTVWENGETKNHTYLLEGTSLVAYIKAGEDKPFYFKNPIKHFDKRGRTFVKVSADPFKVKQAVQPSYLKTVAGSKPGVTYTVNTQDQTCTCPGFTFRGKCKHIQEALL